MPNSAKVVINLATGLEDAERAFLVGGAAVEQGKKVAFGNGSATSMRPSSATDPGTALVAALAECDFQRLAGTLTPDARMRALLPPGFVEISGAEAAAAKFSAWFGDAEELELIHSDSEAVADRLHVSYRLRVKKPGDVPKLVEQHLLCAFDGDRIDALDLVCTGFRPDEATCVVPGTRL